VVGVGVVVLVGVVVVGVVLVVVVGVGVVVLVGVVVGVVAVNPIQTVFTRKRINKEMGMKTHTVTYTKTHTHVHVHLHTRIYTHAFAHIVGKSTLSRRLTPRESDVGRLLSLRGQQRCERVSVIKKNGITSCFIVFLVIFPPPGLVINT